MWPERSRRSGRCGPGPASPRSTGCWSRACRRWSAATSTKRSGFLPASSRAPRSSPKAGSKRATVRYLAENYEGAIADCEATLARKPHHFGALSGQGLCHVALGPAPRGRRDLFRRTLVGPSPPRRRPPQPPPHPQRGRERQRPLTAAPPRGESPSVPRRQEVVGAPALGVQLLLPPEIGLHRRPAFLVRLEDDVVGVAHEPREPALDAESASTQARVPPSMTRTAE